VLLIAIVAASRTERVSKLHLSSSKVNAGL